MATFTATTRNRDRRPSNAFSDAPAMAGASLRPFDAFEGGPIYSGIEPSRPFRAAAVALRRPPSGAWIPAALILRHPDRQPRRTWRYEAICG